MPMPKSCGSVFGNLHLNSIKFVRNFDESEEIEIPRIRFFGFRGFDFDVALARSLFVASNTIAKFSISTKIRIILGCNVEIHEFQEKNVKKL